MTAVSLRTQQFKEIMFGGVVAGAAGGLAEIVWISFWSALTRGDAAAIAREVSNTIGVGGGSAAAGLMVHMGLAVILGAALVLVWRALSRQSPQGDGVYGFMLVALMVVWTINFFVLLPIIGPDFVPLAPYPVSLTSKLLFGLAAAAIVHRGRCGEAARRHGLSPRRAI